MGEAKRTLQLMAERNRCTFPEQLWKKIEDEMAEKNNL